MTDIYDKNNDDKNNDEVNILKQFFDKYEKELKGMGHVNLIVAGKSGTGKSELINATFRKNVAKTGIGRPVTTRADVKWYEEDGYPLRILDTVGLELDKSKCAASIESIKNAIREAKDKNKPDDFIHAMWYCVKGNGDRLEDFEADFINSIAEEIDVVLVLTQSYKRKRADLLIDKIYEEHQNLNVVNKVIVLAADEREDQIDEGDIPKKAYGLDTLIEVTAQILPESAQRAWCNVQKASMDMKVKKAQAIVATTAAAAFGEGYIPLPFADAITLVPTQIGMLAGITTVFGIDIQENMLKTIVMSILGESGAVFAGKTIVSNLLKFIPGVGTVLGGTISGTTAAVITAALGESYIAIIKKIANGEIKEADLANKEIQKQMYETFKEELSKNKKTLKTAQEKNE